MPSIQLSGSSELIRLSTLVAGRQIRRFVTPSTLRKSFAVPFQSTLKQVSSPFDNRSFLLSTLVIFVAPDVIRALTRPHNPSYHRQRHHHVLRLSLYRRRQPASPVGLRLHPGQLQPTHLLQEHRPSGLPW